MASRSFVLDASRSKLSVRTRAAGLLARLAHDLEIACDAMSGEGTVDGSAWSGKLGVKESGLRVVGALKGDRLDTSAISASDKVEIEKRMREQALGGTTEVAVRANGPSLDRGEATVTLARGSARASGISLSVREEGEAIRVRGSASLSAKALGLPPIQAPLGAFKLADAIEVIFDLVFSPA